VAVGHVVLSDQGVVGRVVEVGPNYSKVLLVTDPGSAVAALVQGSRATGIVRGQFGDSLLMEWVLTSEKIEPGDVVLTAGLALGDELRSHYPKGLILGRVVDVTRAENSAYQRAVLQPAVDLRKLEQVLVVKTAP
jgi:rod shape-determining protein MreC